MSALGQKQTHAVQQRMSALPPNSDRESRHRQPVMSALPPRADMCSALADSLAVLRLMTQQLSSSSGHDTRRAINYVQYRLPARCAATLRAGP
jgi:hypothetical protein